MARQRTFIGIGEALLAEYPNRTEPAGLALEVAMAAAALGHRGVPLSRLGQDGLANELLTHIESLADTLPDIDRTHFQSDPDLPTGRLIVRSITGVQQQTLDQRAAFDNLQWDFDLVDLAKQAHAVVFGMCAQRYGQSRSIIVRFIAEATAALTVCDLTNRAGETFERPHALRSLELAQMAVIDSIAWSILKFGRSDVAHEEAAKTLMREAAGGLAAVVWLDPATPIEVYTRDKSFTGTTPIEPPQHTVAVVAFLHAMLNGLETAKAIEDTEKTTAYAREHPNEPVSQELRG